MAHKQPLWLHNLPNASKREMKSEMTHKKAEYLNNPCHQGGHPRFKAEDKIRSGTHLGAVAT